MVCIKRHPCNFEWNKLNVNIDASAYVDATQNVQQGDLLYSHVSFDIECSQIAKKLLKKKCVVSHVYETHSRLASSSEEFANFFDKLLNLITTKYSFKRIEIKTKSPLTWRKSISTARKTHQTGCSTSLITIRNGNTQSTAFFSK